MAQETVDRAIRELNLKPVHLKAQTEHVPIQGGENYSPTLFIKLIQRFGFDRQVAEHLSHSYGDRALEVARLAEPSDSDRVLGYASLLPSHLLTLPCSRRLVPNLPYIEAEIRYAVRNEYARTAVDVLARRTRLAFINANQAADALPNVRLDSSILLFLIPLRSSR